jgi:hypothetical protein
MPLNWEELDSTLIGVTCRRAKVPGGWLVMIMGGLMVPRPRGITFYPDPNHQWDGHSMGDSETARVTKR